MRVSKEQLAVGMYVVLDGQWDDHPFFRNRFLISNEKDLAILRSCPFDSVEVDVARSKVKLKHEPQSMDELSHVSHGDEVVDPKEAGKLPPAWNPQTLVPKYLEEALHSKDLTPKQRAEQVYKHSRTMMKRLLESPTAENIVASKAAIADVTDLVLSDSETALSMLSLTNHDFYTYTHSVNVGVLSIMLAKALYGQSDAHNMHELGAGFFLHDLGKVKVDPAILNKPGRLTDAEMKHVRIHPYQGYKVLQAAGALSEECRLIVMEHHERHDGEGYPKRLRGEEISQYARICCIADVFDALTAERSYKVGMTPFDALKLMKERMNDNFEPALFARFVQLFSQR